MFQSERCSIDSEQACGMLVMWYVRNDDWIPIYFVNMFETVCGMYDVVGMIENYLVFALMTMAWGRLLTLLLYSSGKPRHSLTFTLFVFADRLDILIDGDAFVAAEVSCLAIGACYVLMMLGGERFVGY
uniref:Uncharacterized protein n=2 Tax=Cacopsylla melanoneura TaxID=428564 RepID=A0A8D8R122_9HEMI